ncbi:MAG: outer membrane beta-barrel protein [Pseudomonadota bacterium]
MKQHPIAIALLALSAAAGANEVNPIYVGAAVGQARYQCLYSGSCNEERAASGKLYVGYIFVPVVSWSDMKLASSVELDAYRGAGAKLFSNQDWNASFKGVGALYKANLKASEAFSLNAHLGMAYLETRFDSGFSSARGRFSPVGGLGLSYALDKNWSITLDYDRFHLKFGAPASQKAEMLTIGAGYKF